MLENYDSNAPSRDDEKHSAVNEYLQRAAAATDAGDAVLGMHLYLAAFEEAASMSNVPSEDAMRGLKEAWALACQHRERALAEYIFEKMEPFLSSAELDACVAQLQGLALDRLEEFGVSRKDIEEMTEMISRDLMSMGVEVGVDLGLGVGAIKVGPDGVRHMETLLPKAAGVPEALVPEALEAPEAAEIPQSAEIELAAEPVDSCGCPGCGCDSSSGEGGDGNQRNQRETADQFLAKAAEELAAKMGSIEVPPLNYSTLAGYDSVVGIMRDFGIGLEDDPEFQKLVSLLNTRHGLDGMPAIDSLLFQSPAREDANRFVAATVGELKRPAMRMHMEENLQGLPLLCVTTQADEALKPGNLRNAFANGGVLVLENIDLWTPPAMDVPDEHGKGSFLAAQLTRGAREAINLIRAAVDNPDVYVLATAATGAPIDDFFLDVLEPLSAVDIAYPTPEERYDIWMDIAREHPSLRSVNRADLVRLSANMPRYDIYMAAREAVEEAYKLGLVSRRYCPVARDNIFDKLAAYQPLDSAEYHELEEAVVDDFRREIAGLEDFLRSTDV